VFFAAMSLWAAVTWVAILVFATAPIPQTPIPRFPVRGEIVAAGIPSTVEVGTWFSNLHKSARVNPEQGWMGIPRGSSITRFYLYDIRCGAYLVVDRWQPFGDCWAWPARADGDVIVGKER